MRVGGGVDMHHGQVMFYITTFGDDTERLPQALSRSPASLASFTVRKRSWSRSRILLLNPPPFGAEGSCCPVCTHN